MADNTLILARTLKRMTYDELTAFANEHILSCVHSVLENNGDRDAAAAAEFDRSYFPDALMDWAEEIIGNYETEEGEV